MIFFVLSMLEQSCRSVFTLYTLKKQCAPQNTISLPTRLKNYKQRSTPWHCHSVKISRCMTEFKRELYLLATCQRTTARIIFERAPQEFIRAINDAAWTTLTGNLKLSQKDIDDIQSIEPALRHIASRGQTLDNHRILLTTPSGFKDVKVLFSVLQSHF